MMKDNKYCNLDKLITMLDGDMPSVKEMVEEFLDTIPAYFEDSVSAYEAGDLIKLKSVIHKLKGSIGLIANEQIAAEIVTLHASVGTDKDKINTGMERLKQWFPVLCDELKSEMNAL
ncbi:MAG TPA: hypothetical protein DF637_01555 [Rikenellaceae bacterium]|nr:hypothetical protein [Rikenellaceae bacterium]HCV15008.1 hypothetical protein [Rikenellaceae bacterium]